MGFNLIVPKPKASKGVFRISTGRMGGGAWKLHVSMPSAQFGVLFGSAERFDVLIGDGSDKGKMLLRPNADGHFKPIRLKQTALFRIDGLPNTPEIALSCDDPERREVQGGGLLITLPVWMETWRDIEKARAQVSREREAEKLRGVK